MIDSEASALGVALGRHLNKIPKEVKELANKNQLSHSILIE